MKLKDYYNQELDLTDPKEPKILLDEDDGYQEWSDLLDEERFEEVFDES